MGRLVGFFDVDFPSGVRLYFEGEDSNSPVPSPAPFIFLD